MRRDGSGWINLIEYLGELAEASAVFLVIALLLLCSSECLGLVGEGRSSASSPASIRAFIKRRIQGRETRNYPNQTVALADHDGVGPIRLPRDRILICDRRNFILFIMAQRPR